jgi:hypothetical protein
MHMAQSVFKGTIGTGTIVAKFLSDFSNIDPDLLHADYADTTGGNAQAPHAVAAPGGAVSVQVTAPKQGLLEVFVDTGHDNESGRLQVTRNGTMADDQPITGPVRWVYAVI